MKNLYLLTSALACSFALSAVAQPTPPTPAQVAERQVQRYTAMLTLTSDQQAKALTIFTAEATSVEPLHTSEQALHKALATAVTSDDVATVASTAVSLGAVNGEITGFRATAQAELYLLLTDTQKTCLATIESAHGPGGPGGPHGFGAGGPPPQ